MKSQDRIFFEKEGDAWFSRNRGTLGASVRGDWPFIFAKRTALQKRLKRIAEIGCSNGWRLDFLRKALKRGKFVGVDASRKAVQDGKKRYPGLTLKHGLVSELPLPDASCDLVIVNYVLHWVGRSALAKAVAEIDRVIKDGGYLVLGDVLPDRNQRRVYHHLPNAGVYTYKQDYAGVFASLGIYRELRRKAYNHDAPSKKSADTRSRAFCSVLQKSLRGYYPVVR